MLRCFTYVFIAVSLVCIGGVFLFGTIFPNIKLTWPPSDEPHPLESLQMLTFFAASDDANIDNSPPNNELIDQTCMEPARNIVFLKMHKSGSSTIQNILMRYGFNRNLTFVLPKTGNLLGWPRSFHHRFAFDLRKPPGRFNIFCHHAVFNAKEVAAVTEPNSTFLTVLRHPDTLFESMYVYYHLDRYYNVSFPTFVRDPTRYVQSKPTPTLYTVRNPMLVDMGVVDRQPMAQSHRNVTLLKKAIEDTQLRFDLVMIAEMFDESLILMKEALCWKWDDVLAFKLNARGDRSKTAGGIVAGNARFTRSWNQADFRFYQYFRRQLERRVERYGRDRMTRDVAELTRRRDLVYRQCVDYSAVTPGTEGGKQQKAPRGKLTGKKGQQRQQKVTAVGGRVQFVSLVRPNSVTKPTKSTTSSVKPTINPEKMFIPFSNLVFGFHLKKDQVKNSTCQHLAWSELAFTLTLKRKQWPGQKFST